MKNQPTQGLFLKDCASLRQHTLEQFVNTIPLEELMLEQGKSVKRKKKQRLLTELRTDHKPHSSLPCTTGW